MNVLSLNEIQQLIKDYQDFPSTGITFKDVMPIFSHPVGLHSLNQHICDYIHTLESHPEAIIGIDARGFILGATLACELSLPFIPIRKPGKLPGKTFEVSYQLEYGYDTLQIQSALSQYRSALIVDDLLATGGTASAAEQLAGKADIQVLANIFILELTHLPGRQKLTAPCYALIKSSC